MYTSFYTCTVNICNKPDFPAHPLLEWPVRHMTGDGVTQNGSIVHMTAWHTGMKSVSFIFSFFFRATSNLDIESCTCVLC
ncbi:hypothetical protein GDO81_017924 [Engystomops pustulosus]|uniref:Uncharacterized protein n=1 Tax=Engystomops pustulosus TaxID=76066 RepID=A0AAV7A446_ENGPU|nr:hypothetical protein GDO81_017924 [Engystomops pustulosus]